MELSCVCFASTGLGRCVLFVLQLSVLVESIVVFVVCVCVFCGISPSGGRLIRHVHVGSSGISIEKVEGWQLSRVAPLDTYKRKFEGSVISAIVTLMIDNDRSLALASYRSTSL